jgi:hypothetical protein
MLTTTVVSSGLPPRYAFPILLALTANGLRKLPSKLLYTARFVRLSASIDAHLWGLSARYCMNYSLMLTISSSNKLSKIPSVPAMIMSPACSIIWSDIAFSGISFCCRLLSRTKFVSDPFIFISSLARSSSVGSFVSWYGQLNVCYYSIERCTMYRLLGVPSRSTIYPESPRYTQLRTPLRTCASSAVELPNAFVFSYACARVCARLFLYSIKF